MVQIKPLRFTLMLLALLCAFSSKANVTFQFAAGSIDGGQLKNKMESSLSALLTEINRAGNSNSALNLTGITMQPEAKNRLINFWNQAAHFVCEDEVNIEKCLHDTQGYQVRGIPVTMKPIDDTYTDGINRTLTVGFDKNGVITGLRPAMEKQETLNQILRTTGSGGVVETRMRRELLKWVEDFRCYYNERNLNALKQIYSDDALIITGSVTAPPKDGGDTGVMFTTNKVHYKVQDKETYLKNLANIFNKKQRLNVEFDHISVMKHSSKENVFGVTLRQTWQSGSYHDVGWLFLLWDFQDPEHPMIHVRTWQPEAVMASDGVFTLDDFFIP